MNHTTCCYAYVLVCAIHFIVSCYCSHFHLVSIETKSSARSGKFTRAPAPPSIPPFHKHFRRLHLSSLLLSSRCRFHVAGRDLKLTYIVHPPSSILYPFSPDSRHSDSATSVISRRLATLPVTLLLLSIHPFHHCLGLAIHSPVRH